MLDKKLTVRMTSELVKSIKLKCVKEDKSLQEYVTELIKKDLNK